MTQYDEKQCPEIAFQFFLLSKVRLHFFFKKFGVKDSHLWIPFFVLARSPRTVTGDGDSGFSWRVIEEASDLRGVGISSPGVELEMFHGFGVLRWYPG